MVEEAATEPLAQARTYLESIDPKVAIAGGLLLLCLGIWVGFKLGGGVVTDMAPHRCEDCAEKATDVDTEAMILQEEHEEI